LCLVRKVSLCHWILTPLSGKIAGCELLPVEFSGN